jgi:hypothetical protein
MKKISILIAFFVLLISSTCFAKNMQSVAFVNGHSVYTDLDAVYGLKGPEGQSLVTAVMMIPSQLTEVSILEFNLTNNTYRELYGAAYTRKGSREYESTNVPELAPNRGWKELKDMKGAPAQLLAYCLKNTATIKHISNLGTIESIDDSFKNLTNDINSSFGSHRDVLIQKGLDIEKAIDDAQRNSGNSEEDKIIYEILILQSRRASCFISGLQGDSSAFGEGNSYNSDARVKINKLRMSIADQYKQG